MIVNKNIVIGVMTLITLFSLTFGFYQKTLADAAREEADANAQMATQAAEQARHAQQEADHFRHLAMTNELIAVEWARKAEAKEEQLVRLKKK